MALPGDQLKTMSLLTDRVGVAARTPMPTHDVTSSTQTLAVTGESVAFDDGAAGTTQQIKLSYDGIMSSTGDRLGQDGDTSISWTTGTVLTTEVPWKFKNTEGKDNDTARLATLSNGEYMVDYENGYILGLNAITTASATDTIAYGVRTMVSTIQGDVNVTAGVVSSDTADAYSVDQSGLLESSSVSKASSGNLFKFVARVDRSAPSQIFYLQLLNAASIPADGSVTHLFPPIKIDHTTGTDTNIDLDLAPAGLPASTGIVWALSTTEFAKTEAGDYVSAVVLYK